MRESNESNIRAEIDSLLGVSPPGELSLLEISFSINGTGEGGGSGADAETGILTFFVLCIGLRCNRANPVMEDNFLSSTSFTVKLNCLSTSSIRSSIGGSNTR